MSVFLLQVVPCGAAFFYPHFPPAPSPPAGAKGGFNSQFGCFAPTTVLLARSCGAILVAYMGGRGGRSEWITGGSADRGCSGRGFVARRRVGGCDASRCDAAAVAHDVRASERARSCSGPFGRAEQRSGARIRAGACLSEASLRLTPSGTSGAWQPAGPRPLARLSFAYFSLAKQRKVSRPQAETRYLQVSRKIFLLRRHRNAMTKQPFPLPFGRAEQRSGARIRAGACLSEASLRLTPSGTSGAWQPAGPRPLARLSFAYFSLAKQRKVSRPSGRNQVFNKASNT